MIDSSDDEAANSKESGSENDEDEPMIVDEQEELGALSFAGAWHHVGARLNSSGRPKQR